MIVRKIYSTSGASHDFEESFSLKGLEGQYSLYYANNFMSMLMIRNPRYEISPNENEVNIDICMIGCTSYEGPLSVFDPPSVDAKVKDGKLHVYIGEISIKCAGVSVCEAKQSRADFSPYFDSMPLPIFTRAGHTKLIL